MRKMSCLLLWCMRFEYPKVGIRLVRWDGSKKKVPQWVLAGFGPMVTKWKSGK